MNPSVTKYRTPVNFFVQATCWFICLSLSGCVNPKQLVYFQNLSNRSDSLLLPPFVATVQPGDVLSIQVSSLNPEASSFFNPHATQVGSVPNAGLGASPAPMAGYVVAADSSITLPLLGRVLVAGQSTTAAAERIRVKLKAYLKEPTVSIRNLNFRITVLGEVARPSLFSIPNERVTLPEALGLAGDLTIYGRRDNVLVVREENGRRTYARLDLTKREVFLSPFYYLHPNDVVYVEPGKARVASTDRLYQTVPILLGTLSFIAIIITRF